MAVAESGENAVGFSDCVMDSWGFDSRQQAQWAPIIVTFSPQGATCSGEFKFS